MYKRSIKSRGKQLFCLSDGNTFRKSKQNKKACVFTQQGLKGNPPKQKKFTLLLIHIIFGAMYKFIPNNYLLMLFQ